MEHSFLHHSSHFGVVVDSVMLSDVLRTVVGIDSLVVDSDDVGENGEGISVLGGVVPVAPVVDCVDVGTVLGVVD